MGVALSVVETVKGVVAKKDATLADVVRAATRPTAVVEKPTPLPCSPALTPEVTQAIKELPGLLENLTLPDTRRELTADEKEAVIYAYQMAKKVTKGIAATENSLKTAFHQHFDAVARAKGLITDLTPRTKEGFAVLEDRDTLTAPDLDEKITREVQAGPVSFSADQLKIMEVQGVIDHGTYLRLTRQVRVVDELAVMAAVADNPEFAGYLAAHAQVGAPVAKINIRPKK